MTEPESVFASFEPGDVGRHPPREHREVRRWWGAACPTPDERFRLRTNQGP